MKMRRVMTMLAVGLLAWAGTGFAQEAEQEREIRTVDASAVLRYELTPAGSFSTDSYLTFMRDAVLAEDGKNFMMLSIEGDPVASGLDALDYIGSDLYEVRQPMEKDNVNTTGLVTMEGEVLIPCETAGIFTSANRKGEGIRFLEIIYATEETKNKNEAIIYFTENMFSLSAGEDDTLYKGYAKIYDTKLKRFVEGIELESVNRGGLYDLGDSFALEHGNTTTMYDENGKPIWETTGYINGKTYNALSVKVNGNNFIVDSAGKDLFQSEHGIVECSRPLDYFALRDGEAEKPLHVIDMYGNQILPEAFYSVSTVSVNCFSGKLSQDAGSNTAFTADGSVIAEDVSSLTCVAGGYGYLSLQDQETVIAVTPSGYYPDLEAGVNARLLFYRDGSPLILNTGETLHLSGEAKVSAPVLGLLQVEETTSSGKLLSLYDLFTGEQILPAEYNRFEKAGKYLLACRKSSTGNDVWDVYRRDLVPVE